jgi:hypothetical protein
VNFGDCGERQAALQPSPKVTSCYCKYRRYHAWR